MKIFFVNPPNHPFTETSLLIEPIDSLTVASYIESLGHEVKFIDMDVKKMTTRDLKKHYDKFRPDFTVIIFDYHIPLHNSTECLNNNINIAKTAKKFGSQVIVGGKIATYKCDTLIYKNSPIDICVSYELEIPLRKLFALKKINFKDLNKIQGLSFLHHNKIYKTRGKETKIDINNLPVVNRDLIDIKDYIDVRSVLTSRGCPMNCTFCHVPGFWGGWSSMNPENIFKEIESLYKKNQAKKIIFLNDNAIVDHKKMIDLAKMLIKNKIKVKLGCLGSINLFDLETMKYMYQAGFRWIHYGCEYGDDNVLKKIHKKTTVSMIKKIVKQTLKLGFRVRTSWILDLPETDIHSLKKTIKLISSINSQEIRLHFLSLRLGSALYHQYGNDNLLTQYIHHSNPNNFLTKISQDIFLENIRILINNLKNKGYKIVYNAKDFNDLKTLQINNPEMKIASLCPLRYGINW